jgi:ABC-type Fe3+-citrate transport system substrate-binding protein
MLKKRSILLGFLLTSVLIVSACSDKETSTESKDKTEAKSEVLMVSGDTVTEQGGCVLASRFTTGDKIIFE